MATQILTRNTSALPTIVYNTPQVLDFGIVKDSAGVALDISTGFDARLIAVKANAVTGQDSSPKSGTWSYGADGALKLTLTQAQACEWVPGTFVCQVDISDDSFATIARHQGGSMRVQSP